MRTTSAFDRALRGFLALLVLLVPLHGESYDRRSVFSGGDTGAPLHNARLQLLLEAAVRQGLPGVSLRVVGPGIDFQGAAGKAHLRTGEALTPDHSMYTASLGKTFTATVALQLCEEELLDLEAPISTWLPEAVEQRIPSSERITLRHLLSHTSGLIDYMNDDRAWRSEFVRDPRRQWSHSEVVAYLYDKPLLFEPGTGYHYSNSNYILAGLIIEQASGQSHHRLIRQRILAPLGLQHTFNGQEATRNRQRAHGYIRWRGRLIDTDPWYRHYGLADSGIHSTPGELALFLRALFTSEDVLSAAMRTRMMTVSGLGDPPSRYGLGIRRQRNPQAPGPWFTHDGIDPGYQADMMYLPYLDLTLVLAATASLGEADFIYAKLIRAVEQAALDAVRGHIRHGG